jgi:hypothetical protein
MKPAHVSMEKPTEPYPNDPFATTEDPTPGGPMTWGVVAHRPFGDDIPMEDRCPGKMTDYANGSCWSCSACGWYDDHGPAPHVPVWPSDVSFSIALDYAKQGRAIARNGWPKDCEGGLLLRDGEFFGAPAMVIMSGGLGLPVQDILANDWYVLP